MSAEAAEADALRRRWPDGGPGVAGDDDLLAVGRRADARRGVHGQPDVPDIGQRRAAAVNPRPDADVEITGPCPLAERTLDGHRRVDGAAGRSKTAKYSSARASISWPLARSTRCGGCLGRRSAVAVSRRPTPEAGPWTPRYRSSGGDESWGSAAASVDVAWIWPCTSSFSTTKPRPPARSARGPDRRDRRVVHDAVIGRPWRSRKSRHAGLPRPEAERACPCRRDTRRTRRTSAGRRGRIARTPRKRCSTHRGRVLPQLDHEAAGRCVSPLRLQLPRL